MRSYINTTAGGQLDKVCTHPLPPHIVVIESTINCETTVQACPCCGKHLTKPKTDC